MYMIDLILGDLINLLLRLIYIYIYIYCIWNTLKHIFMIMSFKCDHIIHSTNHLNMVSFGNLIISCVLQTT